MRATAEAGVLTAAPATRVSSRFTGDVGIMLAPSVLLVAGALVGFAWTLDQRVASERLLGLFAAAALATVALVGLRRATQTEPLLLATAAVALLGGVWVIAATDPQVQAVLRGPVGAVLLPVLRPVVGALRLGDPVEITNTRFIVGYNGLADLCLLAVFASGAVLLGRSGRRARWAAWVLLVVGMVLLLGTGSRGALTGLAAGACAAGLLLWRRRAAWLLVLVVPLLAGVVALSVLDKGLEFSSTSGRLEYWGDLTRLLVEYPLTGVGLGVNTANRVAVEHEINPDPERIAYAHNTFVQTYLEQGPLGTLGAVLVPVVAAGVVLAARQTAVPLERRALLLAGVAVVCGLEAHGLTDQVLTTNVGGCLVLLGLAAALAGVGSGGQVMLAAWLRRGLVVVGAVLLAGLLLLALVPGGRALALLNLGSLQLNRALALPAAGRSAGLVDAESTLEAAHAAAPDHPAVLRQLARLEAARFDDAAALGYLRQAAASPNLDGFDMLQLAHVHRTLGLTDEAYAWAARAYEAWGRPLDDRILLTYAQGTLADDAGGHRARTLAQQAEAAMRARAFGQAVTLFGQALTFAPTNVYLQDRLAGAQRGVARYGDGPTIDFE